MQQSERRHRYRTETELPVTWSVLDPPGAPLSGTIISLSSGGARMVATSSPSVGQLVSITLQAVEPALDLVACGRVIWVWSDSRPGQCIWAVAFEGLDLEAQALVARFVFCEASRRGKGARRVAAEVADGRRQGAA